LLDDFERDDDRLELREDPEDDRLREDERDTERPDELDRLFDLPRDTDDLADVPRLLLFDLLRDTDDLLDRALPLDLLFDLLDDLLTVPDRCREEERLRLTALLFLELDRLEERLTRLRLEERPLDVARWRLPLRRFVLPTLERVLPLLRLRSALRVTAVLFRLRRLVCLPTLLSPLRRDAVRLSERRVRLGLSSRRLLRRRPVNAERSFTASRERPPLLLRLLRRVNPRSRRVKERLLKCRASLNP